MNKAFKIGLALTLLAANTALAQTVEPAIYAVPQDSSILNLTYPYYEFVLTPSTTDTTTTTDPATRDPAVNSSDPTTTDPTQPVDPTSEPTDTTDPAATGTFAVPEETTGDTMATTDPVDSNSTTLFVPPEREPVQPEQPRDPRQPPPQEPEEPRECPEQILCPSAGEIIERTIPQVIANQWRVALLVFGGAAAGGIVWFAMSLLFNNAHSRREQAILHTRATVKNDRHRTDQLKNSHEKISNSIASLSEIIAKSKQPSVHEIEKLKKAGAGLELFGSESTRKAYNNLLNIISDTATTEKQFSSATKKLFTSLKKDLGLT